MLPKHMLPPDKPAECECSGWTYASSMGEWKERAHHPRCPKGHNQETCQCFRCSMKRGEIERTMIAYGVGPDDTE